MGLGDPPTPVPNDAEYNNPTSRTVLDDQRRIQDRLVVLERVLPA